MTRIVVDYNSDHKARDGLDLRSNAMAVAQAWRGRPGRQVNLVRLLRAVDVRAVHERDGRAAGVLLAAAGTADAIDASVVLLAAPGDRILTSDPSDLARLAAAGGGGRPVIIACWPEVPAVRKGRLSGKRKRLKHHSAA